LAVVMVAGPMLGACAAQGPEAFTQAGRVGPDDGTDSCHAQAVALDNTGNFFAQDILTGAALGAAGGALLGGLASGNLKGALIGAAAGGAVGAAGGYWEALQQQSQNTAQLESTMTNNLTQENAQINATQIAFDNDMDCRFQQAAAIRAAYRAGTITEDQAAGQMAQVKTLAQRDLQLAQTINGQIQSRGAQFDTATANLGGGPAPAPSVAALSKPALLRRDEDLLLRPDAAAPPVGSVKRRESVTITAVTDGYGLVQTADGSTGYVPMSALREPSSLKAVYVAPAEEAPPPAEPETAVAPAAPAAPVASAAPASTGTVRQLDGSNAASRDAFAQNVAVSQSAVSKGFQLAT
jgi:hypothetical protein